uniref:Uncharacterized protein n=1 Tax=Knipowitschia caucasica TaxID=637954 RepID=A0AAV2KVV1_KNICA
MGEAAHFRSFTERSVSRKEEVLHAQADPLDLGCPHSNLSTRPAADPRATLTVSHQLSSPPSPPTGLPSPVAPMGGAPVMTSARSHPFPAL